MSISSRASRHGQLPVLMIFVLITAFGCNNAGESGESAASAGPKTASAAVRVFIDGLKKEDIEKALAAHDNPERAKAVVTAQIRSIAATNQFRHALQERFGGQEFIPLMPTLVSPLVESLNSRPPVEEGDKASWSFAGPTPMLLVRREGVWYLDWSNRTDEELNGMAAEMESTASVFESVSADIEAGKFKDTAESVKTLGEKLEKLGKPSGRG